MCLQTTQAQVCQSSRFTSFAASCSVPHGEPTNCTLMQFHIHIMCQYRLNSSVLCNAPSVSARPDLKCMYVAGPMHARLEMQPSTQSSHHHGIIWRMLSRLEPVQLSQCSMQQSCNGFRHNCCKQGRSNAGCTAAMLYRGK